MAFKVLVVDDNHDLRELMLKVLVSEGFEAEGAENGKVAFGKIQANKPDLVISDIRMPVWDGFELMKQVEAMPPPPAPILFMSGYVGADEVSLKMNNVCVGFMEKPVKRRHLVDFVRAFQVEHRAAGRGAGSLRTPNSV